MDSRHFQALRFSRPPTEAEAVNIATARLLSVLEELQRQDSRHFQALRFSRPPTEAEAVNIATARLLSVLEELQRQEEMEMAMSTAESHQDQHQENRSSGARLFGDTFDSYFNPSFTSDSSEDKPENDGLPDIYKDYRVKPTAFKEQHMWPEASIQRQKLELEINRGEEKIVIWQPGQSENDRCLVCLTNVATRLAVPCGHKLSCRKCFQQVLKTTQFHLVTAGNGSIVRTNFKIPIQCFICRSIVGLVVVPH